MRLIIDVLSNTPLQVFFQPASYVLIVIADVPITSHAIDLVLIQDNPKPEFTFC